MTRIPVEGSSGVPSVADGDLVVVRTLSPDARPSWSDVTSAGVFRVEPDGRFDRHFHDCDEYWLVFSGRARVLVGSHVYEVAPGDIVCTPTGTEHDVVGVYETLEAFWFEGRTPPGGRIGHLHATPEDAHGHAVRRCERVTSDEGDRADVVPGCGARLPARGLHMNPRPRFLVICPATGVIQTPGGTDRVVHGGRRYRKLADSLLSAHGEVVHLRWVPGAPPEEHTDELDASLTEVDAVVMTPWFVLLGLDLPPFDSARLESAPNLRVIAGTHDFRLGWIDLDEAIRRGVVVVDTSRAMTPTVAEFGVAITLALLRDIPGAIEVVRGGGWISGMEAGSFIFRDLAECRVGLAGYGSINRHYRRFIGPYGCEVAAFDPLVDEDDFAADSVARADSLTELAEASDILVVAIPPTPSTLGIVDGSVIDALAPGSLFVLLSRMAVVDQDALWRRVRAGEIRAAVDVFEPEPPPAHAWFRTASNVLPTPHIAGNVRFAHERCFREACADAVRVLNGDAPQHAVAVRDKQVYDGTLAAANSKADRR